MAWVESHTVLRRHRKTVGLARDLRIIPEWVMGHLHALWHTVLEQQEDGDLSSWSDEAIAAAGGFKADPAKVVELLLKHKLIDEGARTVHDWLDYAGLYLIRKYARRNKARLKEIWAKHGKVYGTAETETPSDSRSDCRNDNLATGKQLLLAPNLPNQTNQPTNATGREVFNPGYDAHRAIAEQAARLVKLFLDRTKTQFRSTAKPAERALAQLFLDEPSLDTAAIERGITAYARECESASSKPCGPGPFFEKRMWESYGDAVAVGGVVDRVEHNRRLKERFGDGK